MTFVRTAEQKPVLQLLPSVVGLLQVARTVQRSATLNAVKSLVAPARRARMQARRASSRRALCDCACMRMVRWYVVKRYA